MRLEAHLPLAEGSEVLNLLVALFDSLGWPEDLFIENLRLLNDILAEFFVVSQSLISSCQGRMQILGGVDLKLSGVAAHNPSIQS